MLNAMCDNHQKLQIPQCNSRLCMHGDITTSGSALHMFSHKLSHQPLGSLDYRSEISLTQEICDFSVIENLTSCSKLTSVLGERRCDSFL